MPVFHFKILYSPLIVQVGFYNTRKVCEAWHHSSARHKLKLGSWQCPYIYFFSVFVVVGGGEASSPTQKTFLPLPPPPPLLHLFLCVLPRPVPGRSLCQMLGPRLRTAGYYGRTDVVASPSAHAGPSLALSVVRCNVVSFPACVLRMSERGPKMAATS